MQNVPLFPDLSYTRQASADITGGALVAVSGDGTVATATAATTGWLGAAAFDVKSGGDVTVHTGGVQRLKASGAVTAGDLVAAAAAGAVATAGATPAAGTLVGLALSTAADGETVETHLFR